MKTIDLSIYSNELLKAFDSAKTIDDAYSAYERFPKNVFYSDVEYLFVMSGFELMTRRLKG